MGNHAGKDNHVPTGSPLDFFHTPPSSPSEAELAAMALPTAASPDKAQTPSPADGTPTSTTPPPANWTQTVSSPSGWAVISVDSTASSDSVTGGRQKAMVSPVSPDSPASLPLSRGSPSEHSWQERDSGMEHEAAAERAGEEMTLVLASLMEHYGASLGLTPSTDITAGAVDLLRRLITEREELVEDLDTLRETNRTERLEWNQFQCDLQVAVSVADRLRVESEQALGLLQESHRAVEEQLAQALGRQREMERELESLRHEHSGVCRKLSELTVKLQQERAELDILRSICSLKEEQTDQQAEQHQPDEEQGFETQKSISETEDKDENNANQDSVDDSGAHDREKEETGQGNMLLSGKGVAEGYIRSLAALEKKKEEGRGQKDPRKIVMLSERSWSLSRIPLHTDSPSQNGNSKNLCTTLPLCKKEEPTKGRMDRVLKRQDSWSSFYMGKQEDDQSSDFIKPQDGFSALLRRHGGSRRNSLLRWCQSRTHGYKNIEITNFSSSWEDGLALCAVYHTYLPDRIPYDSLSPADKKENLDLAFKTGEEVGIRATLTVEEMLKAEGPDWQRVLGYVESIFRHFEM